MVGARQFTVTGLQHYGQYAALADENKRRPIIAIARIVHAEEALKMKGGATLPFRLQRRKYRRRVSIMGDGKDNPWKGIALSDYENHMSLDSVMQLQSLNRLMLDQLDSYPAETVMILGIAGGNGLEHINARKFRKVFGIDINAEYLATAKDRYPQLSGVLECLCIDLACEAEKLPRAELLIADLLIEYIGYECFQRVIEQVRPKYVSCIIQVNTDEAQWVSDSPYLHAFDRLDEVHHQMEENTLVASMKDVQYHCIATKKQSLPNGKMLVLLDFEKDAA